MSEPTENYYILEWLGFNEEPNYDRIWGFLRMKDGRIFTFWGVRGKRLDFKAHRTFSYNSTITTSHIEHLKWQKEQKGYKQIHPNHYELIAPGFKSDLEIWCTTAIISDNLR